MLLDRDQQGAAKFAYLDPLNSPIGSIARLMSDRTLPAGNGVCFVRFFYQLQGDKAGSIQLYSQLASKCCLVCAIAA